MGNYIEVIEKRKVPKNCSTCLYSGCDKLHCGHAGNGGKLMFSVNFGQACHYYWLDQNRFTRA